MAFDVDAWKNNLKEHLHNWKPRMQRAGVNSIYYGLSAAALWPLVQAGNQEGLLAAVMALGQVASGVGGNLIANQLQDWKERSEAEIAGQLQAQVSESPELRAALDAVLDKLETFTLAQEQLDAKQQAWFKVALHEELQSLGSQATFVAGDLVKGDKVKGNKITGKNVFVVEPGGQVVIRPEKDGSAPGQGKSPKEKDVHWQARRNYLERLRRFCQALPLAALGGEPDANETVTLDQVYIDLDTTSQMEMEEGQRSKKRPGARTAERMAFPDGKESRPLAALEVFCQTPRLVLLGDPGSGKSTFVRKLLAWLAAAHLDKQVTAPPGCSGELLPVLVVLRDLAVHLEKLALESFPADQQRDKLAQAARQYILEQLDGYHASDFSEMLGLALEKGSCLLALDGLDEVPQAVRPRMRQAVAAMLYAFHPQRAIVTCRVRSYTRDVELADFQAHTLAAFDEEKIQHFVIAWYQAQSQLGRLEAQVADERAKDLAEAALGPDLRDLSANPLMLTVMAIIHQKEIGLPRERVRLYGLAVDVLLRRWQQHKAGELSPSPRLAEYLKDDLRLRAAMERLAYEAQHASPKERSAADLPRGQALVLLDDSKYLGDPGLASEFLDYVDQRAGLLVGQGGDLQRPTSYSFPHRSFQEYLAGCYLIGQRDTARVLLEHAAQGGDWDLAVQLGTEELLYNRRGQNTLLDLAYSLCPERLPKPERDQRAVLWSGRMAALLGGPVVERDAGSLNGGPAYLKRLRAHLVGLLDSRKLAPVERGEAGVVLGKLGDPRPEALALDGMQFCWMPAGPFRMGSDKQRDEMAYDTESSQSEMDVPPCWIARHPATNAQFAAFTAAGGYREARYWGEAQAHKRWQDGLVIRTVYTAEGRKEERAGQPYDYGEPFNLPNHPVVGVTWYEALAFTRWLDEIWRKQGYLGQGWGVRLPSEAEWEKAARGGLRVPVRPVVRTAKDGLDVLTAELALQDNPLVERRYPWGNDFEAHRLNAGDTGIGHTSAIGCFPTGASPYGVLDLSGNVWEWTRSLWGKRAEKPDFPYPYDATDGREDLQADSDVARGLRGGAFLYIRRLMRCAYRRGNVLDGRSADVGFRVLAAPF